jgi:hypothetical protein
MTWTLVSMVTSLALARISSARRMYESAPAVSTKEEAQQRLMELEVTEIPWVRSALGEWVDDAHLATRVRELEQEAQGLREMLGV